MSPILEKKIQELTQKRQDVKEAKRALIKELFTALPTLESFKIKLFINWEDKMEINIEHINNVDWAWAPLCIKRIKPLRDSSASYRSWLLEINLTAVEFADILSVLNELDPDFLTLHPTTFKREEFL